MSADILTFPGDGLPDRPITEQEVDRLHSKNFRDLEGRINDCASMAAIALEMAMPVIVGISPQHEKAQFAICKAAQMLKQLQTDYKAAWHGEIDLDDRFHEASIGGANRGGTERMLVDSSFEELNEERQHGNMAASA